MLQRIAAIHSAYGVLLIAEADIAEAFSDYFSSVYISLVLMMIYYRYSRQIFPPLMFRILQIMFVTRFAQLRVFI